MPYAPIRILLLGINQGDDARDEVARRLSSMAAGGGGMNLGAWMTALIESGGPEGVLSLERLFLAAPGSLDDARHTYIVRALSVQSAESDPTLRTSIDSTLRRFVSLRPDAAPLIAQAFGAAEDYSQVALIREFVAARAFTERRDLMAATAYIARAARRTRNKLAHDRGASAEPGTPVGGLQARRSTSIADLHLRTHE